MDNPRIKLKRICIKGFKSFGEAQEILFEDETLLIGANGSGKSNLISFFSMLNHIRTGGFQSYVEQQGGANSILHYGAKKTKTIEYEIEFCAEYPSESRLTTYNVLINYGMPDRLLINGEKISYQKTGMSEPLEYFLEPGFKESDLSKDNQASSRVVSYVLSNCRVFQFHDTSKEARFRQACNINDNRYLKSDGGNLAAFLFAIKQNEPRYYTRIVNQIKAVFPLFGDFELEPLRLNENMIMLNWYEKDSDYLFGPHQLSDGTLRFIALTTLLLQPAESRPSVIIIDEPELGLHPSALESLSGMVHLASHSCQVFLATQSSTLLNDYDADNVLIIQRDQTLKQSIVKKLSSDDLHVWKDEYSLAELWDKNILGGRP